MQTWLTIFFLFLLFIHLHTDNLSSQLIYFQTLRSISSVTPENIVTPHLVEFWFLVPPGSAMKKL